MRSLRIWLIALACLTAVFGCATAGKEFSSEGFKQLNIGRTTEKEVLEIFGEPFKRQTRAENNIEYHFLTYSYARATVDAAKGRYLDMEFTNGVLNGYLFASDLEGDSTDFDVDAVQKLKEKPAQVNDYVKLLGRPNGELLMPTIMLKKNFGTMPEAVPPANASKATIYLFSTLKRESRVLNSHVKLLIVYSSSDGAVIETRYFKGTL